MTLSKEQHHINESDARNQTNFNISLIHIDCEEIRYALNNAFKMTLKAYLDKKIDATDFDAIMNDFNKLALTLRNTTNRGADAVIDKIKENIEHEKQTYGHVILEDEDPEWDGDRG